MLLILVFKAISVESRYGRNFRRFGGTYCLHLHFRRHCYWFIQIIFKNAWSYITQPPIQCVPGALTLRVKRPGREACHSTPSSGEVNMRGAILPLPQYVFMAWCVVKDRNNITFYPNNLFLKTVSIEKAGKMN